MSHWFQFLRRRFEHRWFTWAVHSALAAVPGGGGGQGEAADCGPGSAAAVACGDPAMLRRALKLSLSLRVSKVGQGPGIQISVLTSHWRGLGELGICVGLGLCEPKKGCDIGQGSYLHSLAVPGGTLILKLSAPTSQQLEARSSVLEIGVGIWAKYHGIYQAFTTPCLLQTPLEVQNCLDSHLYSALTFPFLYQSPTPPQTWKS